MKRFYPYFKYLRPVLPQLIIALLSGVVFGITGGFGIPTLVQKVFPEIFESDKEPIALSLLLFYCSLPFMVMAVRGTAGFLNTYLLGYCSVHMTMKLQREVFTKLQVLPLSFFKKHSDGDLMARATVDVGMLRVALVDLAQELVKQPTTLIGALGYLVYLCYTQTNMLFLLLLIGFIPITIIPIRIAGKKLKRRAISMQAQVGNLTQHVSQNLRSVREVRAYVLEESEKQKYRSMLEEYRIYFLKITKYNVILSPIIEIISAVGIGVALFYAYHAGVRWEAFLAAVTALYLCYEPIKKLGALHNKIQQALASVDRVEEILHEPVSIDDPADPVEVHKLKGEIAFHQVEFAYQDVPVLREINLCLKAGRSYALVGPSGAGKSTFANLIPRFYDVSKGGVTIDGIDIRNMRLHDLRRNIALVSQEPILFGDTVYNNILVGRPEASREEVMAAARDAYAHHFIEEMEQGYDTQVGQAGGRLSGGQRQRIALARAFLKDAPIVILDEATSALDAVSEDSIQKALSKLMQGKTVIIIAHRFSSIRNVDEILVFNEGIIVERGCHDELMDQDSFYRILYSTQAD